MEPRFIRISAFVLAAVILLGSLSIWAVSTQDTATADVGDVYDIKLNGNDDLEGVLSNSSGEFGGINENKTLFNITLDEDYPEKQLNGTISVYNTNEIGQYLDDLDIQLKANGEEVGWVGLSIGYVRFEISRRLDETHIYVNTTGEGSYTMRNEGEFDLGFLAEVNEKQETVRSQEILDMEGEDLTISSTDGGSVVEPGEGTFTYDNGEIIDLEAVPNTGYRFIEWTGDNSTIDDTTANQTTIEMLDNYTITAEFEPVNYELNLDSTSGGNVTEPGEGTFTYQHGTIVDLEAIADNNSSFLEWSGDNSTIDDTTANQTTIEMLDNYSITAVFDAQTYDLTIDSTENGSVVEPGEGTFTYYEGDTVDLEAVANTSYRFNEWTGDNGTIADVTANQTTIEMLDNYTITAEFIPKTYNLTINSTEGGSVTQPGEGTYTYQYGEIVSLEAVADAGYRFDEWTGENGTIADTTSNQTSIEILDNYNITAEFVRPGLLQNSEFIDGTDYWTREEEGGGDAEWDGTENYENGGSVHVSATQVGTGTTTHTANWSQEVEPTSDDITINGAFRIDLYAEKQGNDIASAIGNASIWVYDSGTGSWEQVYFEEENIVGDDALNTGWGMFEPEETYSPVGEVTEVKVEMNVEVSGDDHNQGPQTATADVWMDNITAVPITNQVNSLNNGPSMEEMMNSSLAGSEEKTTFEEKTVGSPITSGKIGIPRTEEKIDHRRNK